MPAKPNKFGIPLSLQDFAYRCAVAGLRTVELSGFIWRVSAPTEHVVVLVNAFGVDQPLYKIGESKRSPWLPLTGGVAEVVLLALGNIRHKPIADMKARLSKAKTRSNYSNGSPNGKDHYQGASLTAATAKGGGNSHQGHNARDPKAGEDLAGSKQCSNPLARSRRPQNRY